MLARTASTLALYLVFGCNATAPDPKLDESAPPEPVAAADFSWDGQRTRAHRDRPSGLRFAVPVTGYRVTATHFTPRPAPDKLVHELRIEEDRREVVRIDVWHDSEGLGLSTWFDRYLRFMLTHDALLERGRAARADVDAIVIRHPRSPHATARRAVVLALEGRIVRVTTIDDGDPESRAVAAKLVAELEAEALP